MRPFCCQLQPQGLYPHFRVRIVTLGLGKAGEQSLFSTKAYILCATCETGPVQGFESSGPMDRTLKHPPIPRSHRKRQKKETNARQLEGTEIVNGWEGEKDEEELQLESMLFGKPHPSNYPASMIQETLVTSETPLYGSVPPLRRSIDTQRMNASRASSNLSSRSKRSQE